MEPAKSVPLNSEVSSFHRAISKQRTAVWDQMRCPYFTGCPYLAGLILTGFKVVYISLCVLCA
jgi:hypothetical protein